MLQIKFDFIIKMKILAFFHIGFHSSGFHELIGRRKQIT